MPPQTCRCHGTGADGCEPHEPRLTVPTVPLNSLADSFEQAFPPSPVLGVEMPLSVLGAIDQLLSERARVGLNSAQRFAPVIQLRDNLSSGGPDAA